jgi:hypothetical protein
MPPAARTGMLLTTAPSLPTDTKLPAHPTLIGGYPRFPPIPTIRCSATIRRPIAEPGECDSLRTRRRRPKGRRRASGPGGGSRHPLYSEPGGGNRFRSIKQITLGEQIPVITAKSSTNVSKTYTRWDNANGSRLARSYERPCGRLQERDRHLTSPRPWRSCGGPWRSSSGLWPSRRCLRRGISRRARKLRSADCALRTRACRAG